jgi:peptidoglycan hydrolase-like protein with peptidoglycan-binding domain
MDVTFGPPAAALRPYAASFPPCKGNVRREGVALMNRFWHGVIAAGGCIAAAGITLAGAVPGGAAAAARAPAAVTVQVAAAQTTSSGYVPAKRTLEYGMHGSDVKALQQRLAQLKYYPGPADGNFGPDTLEAVWAFQEVQGLSADGIVGPLTEHALVYPRAPQSQDPRGGALRVEVNLHLRVLLLYRSNQLALVSHVSTGGGYYYCSNGSCAYAITPTGHFTTTVFMPGWVTVPLGQMWNPVFFIGTAYAIHGDTYVPLQPVSHGCVRIPMDIAVFFHTLVTTPGTPVYIYG